MTLLAARVGLIAGARATPDPARVEAAVAGAQAAMRWLRSLTSFDRAAILDGVASTLREERQSLAAALAREAGRGGLVRSCVDEEPHKLRDHLARSESDLSPG
jgi:acyl-CoA reductase-like NAD-dependent aldehyde dehydrogenase